MTPAPAAAARAKVPWVDDAKGLGILAVVVWHVSGGLLGAGVPDPGGLAHLEAAWDTYAIRAMPLFFLLSGFFVVGSLRRTTGAFLAVKARSLLYPYVVWSVISILLGTVVRGTTNNDVTLADLPRLLYAPILQYWYLYALFVVTVGFLVLYRLRLPLVLIAVVGVGLYVVTVATFGVRYQGDADSSRYVIAQIGYLAPFFAVGALVGRELIERLPTIPGPALALCAAVGLGATFAIAVAGPLLPPLWLPLVVATISTAGFVALAVLLARSGRFGFARTWGRYSLEIYVAHLAATAAVRILLLRGGHVDDYLVQLVVGTVAGLYLPLLLVRLTQTFRWPYLFTWPTAVSAATPGLGPTPSGS